MIKDEEHGASLRDCLHADGLSLPAIATRLRSWARERGDVERLVFGHNGEHYTLAVLLKDAPVSCAGTAECQLYDLMPFRPGTELQIFTVDGNHREGELFSRPASYEVLDKSTPTNRRAA